MIGRRAIRSLNPPAKNWIQASQFIGDPALLSKMKQRLGF